MWGIISRVWSTKKRKGFTHALFSVRGTALPHPGVTALFLLSAWGEKGLSLRPPLVIREGQLNSRIFLITDDQVCSKKGYSHNFIIKNPPEAVGPWRNPVAMFCCFLCCTQNQVLFSIHVNKKQDSWTKGLYAGMSWCYLFFLKTDVKIFWWFQPILFRNGNDNLFVSLLVSPSSWNCKLVFWWYQRPLDSFRDLAESSSQNLWEGKVIDKVLWRSMVSKERISLLEVESRMTPYFSLSWLGRTRVLFIEVQSGFLKSLRKILSLWHILLTSGAPVRHIVDLLT